MDEIISWFLDYVYLAVTSHDRPGSQIDDNSIILTMAFYANNNDNCTIGLCEGN